MEKKRLTSRDIQAQETRKKLLQTAMELIAREGYHAVTISRICKECGVSVGTFYQYFSAKRDIIVLVDREHNQYLSTACAMDSSKSARQLYTAFVETYMDLVASSGPVLSRALMVGMLEGDVNDDEAGVPLQQEFLGKVLEHGRKTGEFSPTALSDEEFFELFSITINGILATWFFDPDIVDIKEYGCRHMIRLLRLLEPS